MRDCIRCKKPFEPIPSMEARLQARGSHQKICASCVLYTIYDLAAESVAEMSDEEIAAELRDGGVDVEAFAGKVKQTMLDALDRHHTVVPPNDRQAECPDCRCDSHIDHLCSRSIARAKRKR